MRTDTLPATSVARQSAQVTTAIQLREDNGEQTTLRQLHKVANLTQPQALTVLAELERAGIVRIEHNMSDAFESTIALNKGDLGRVELSKSRAESAGSDRTAA